MPTQKRSTKKSAASPSNKKQKVPLKSEETKVEVDDCVAVVVEVPAKLEEKKVEVDADVEESRLIGSPVPCDEAHRRWPHRYLSKTVSFFFVSICCYSQ